MVQRYLCARSQRSAAIALGLSGPVVAFQFLLFLLIGVGLAAFYANSPEGAELAGDQAFAAFLAAHTPTGIRGLLFAAVIAAAISTLSSSLNASAGVAVNDLLKPRDGAPRSSDRTVWLAKMGTLTFALLQAGVAIGSYYYGLEQSVISLVLNVAGFTTGVLVGLFALGMLRGSTKTSAAMTALGVGVAVGAAVFVWNQNAEAALRINGMWNALIASSSTLIAGLVADRIMGPNDASN